VIYPPVDIKGFTFSPAKEDFYVAASRMVPYKRMDLIVEAFRSMPERRLIVMGDGPELGKVRSLAGKNVELLGYQPTEVLRQYLQRAKAFVFAAEEDFGIMPVEAQACGTPVIAFGRGGATETVVPLGKSLSPGTGRQSPTGVFFLEQTPKSLVDAILRFERAADVFDAAAIRANAERFGRERFLSEFKGLVLSMTEECARR
jgi:glycosyltransferase involved in cell wall biosynthesis